MRHLSGQFYQDGQERSRWCKGRREGARSRGYFMSAAESAWISFLARSRRLANRRAASFVDRSEAVFFVSQRMKLLMAWALGLDERAFWRLKQDTACINLIKLGYHLGQLCGIKKYMPEQIQYVGLEDVPENKRKWIKISDK